MLARQYGLGIEIAEFCTASNIDQDFEKYDSIVLNTIRGVERRTLHGPFNELFPCAIDPRARELAAFRYWQAIELAKRYAAEKVVLHGGFQPYLYFPQYYVEQSGLFWKHFMNELTEKMGEDAPVIVLENVLEPDPGMLLQIVKQAEHPKLKLCLDLGHVNAYSKVRWEKWIEESAPYLSHVHLHNNAGDYDTHSTLSDGNLPIQKILEKLQLLAPEASICLEIPAAESSVKYLEQTVLK